MLTAVTGAAGHVGTNLCLALRADGHAVRAVDIREPATAIRHGANWVRADIRDPAAMRAAFTGVDVVYHLAAVISTVGGLGGLVNAINVDALPVVLDAAHRAGVHRYVHGSSVHAFDLVACTGTTMDESSPPSLGATLPAYDRSKALGEAEVRRWVDRGLDAVVVNPTAIIGAIDEEPSRMGQMLQALWRRRLPVLVEGGFDWVDVRDVVSAFRAAGERGLTGQGYLVSGHRLSVAALAQTAMTVANAMPMTRRIAPMWSVRLTGPIADVVARRTGNALLPTREAVRALAAFPLIDGTKARVALNHHPRPIADTLASLHSYFVGRSLR
jgi:dihydroflavonol-4-reductase